MNRQPILCAIGILGLWMCVGGCSSDVARVTGHIKLDGEPLKKARISFQPEGGHRASTAIADDNGYYELQYLPNQPGAKVGKHTVQITSEYEDEDQKTGKVIAYKERLPKHLLKKKWQKEVKPGSNVFDFDLQSK